MNKLKLALDWTPNANHIGFLVAKEKGYYKDKEIELEIIDPRKDNYAITPGKKLEMGEVDFAIAPFESVISYNNKANPIEFKAVYAVLQTDLSSIASLASSRINSPKDLDGKIYASYKARYEDLILEEMILNDGGAGNIDINYPDKLGIWETLLKGKADATWIFDNWEGVEAAGKNIDLKTFKMSDYDVPYCYSPVVMASKDEIEKNKQLYSDFIDATKQGFLFATENIEESANMLSKYATDYDKENIDFKESINISKASFGSKVSAGKMDEAKILSFLEWLVEKDLESNQILTQKLYTNELFSD